MTISKVATAVIFSIFLCLMSIGNEPEKNGNSIRICNDHNCIVCAQRRVAILELEIVRRLAIAELLDQLPNISAPLDQRIAWIERQEQRIRISSQDESVSIPASKPRLYKIPPKGSWIRNEDGRWRRQGG